MENDTKNIEDGKKIELLLKNDNNDQNDQGISLNALFKNIKNHFKPLLLLTLFLMVLGMGIGLFIAEKSEGDAYVSAIVNFTYPEAMDELTPNGEALDVSYLKSSYIVSDALIKSKLDSELAVEWVKNNIHIDHITTESYRQKKEILENFDADTVSAIREVLSLEVEYESRYVISMTNGFGRGNKKISTTDLQRLLDNVIDVYNDYFVNKYAISSLPINQLSAYSSLNLDYAESLDVIKDDIIYLENYCKEMQELFPNFRSKGNGLSFDDLLKKIDLINSNNYSWTRAKVYYDNLTKNKSRLISIYNSKKLELESSLNKATLDIAKLNDMITAYKNDEILVSDPATGTSTSTTSTMDYYNTLIQLQVEMYKSQATLTHQISEIDDRINQLSASGTPDENLSTEVEDEISEIVIFLTNVYNEIYSESYEIITSGESKTLYFNIISAQVQDVESFVSLKTIKLTAIGTGLGLFLGLAYMFIYAFNQESKKKEEVTNA